MTSLLDMATKLMRSIVYFGLVLFSVLYVGRAECRGINVSTPRGLAQLLVSAGELPCGSMNLQSERRVCVVNSLDDERHLVCPSGIKDCDIPCGIQCKGGTIKKTCYPICDGAMTYSCVCHTYVTGDVVTPPLTWSEWELKPGAIFPATRHLLLDNDPCDAIVEYSAGIYIIMGYGLPPEDVCSASTVQPGGHEAFRASLV